MRILLVSHSYTDPGYWDKLDALARRVELAVVTPSTWRGYLHPEAPVPEPAEGAAWRLHRLPAFGSGRAFRYVYHPRPLAAMLASFRPDLVHVEEEPESMSTVQLCLLRRVYGYRLVFFTWENVNILPAGRPMRAISFRSADAGIVGNSAALARCRQLGYRGPLELIPQYGFDVQPEGGRTRRNRPVTVGYAGRLVPEKGLRVLSEAVRSIVGAELLVAGSGPMEAELRRLIHVRWLGALQRSAMDAFWRQIDVLALPSITTPRWAEQFGRVLVEAMGRGIPVIGSDSGAIPEVIGDAGLVTPEGDTDALASAIRRVRDDALLRAELVARGRLRASRCYSREVITDKTVTLYERVLGRHAAA
jgi:glycosyltransferase involved in cell wall biosynthesis